MSTEQQRGRDAMNAPAPDKPTREAVVPEYTTPDSLSTVDLLREAAPHRTFAIADPVRRAYVLHGYLLALEDIVAVGQQP